MAQYVNDYQQVFTVSFSVLYGMMLQNAMNLGLYNFAAEKGRSEAYLRTFLALVFINLGPFATFAYIYTILLPWIINRSLGFFQIMGIFLISLIVFGWFRVLHLIIFKYRYTLYPSRIFNNSSEKYSSVTKRLDDMGTWMPGHWLAILFYVGIFGLGVFFLFLQV